MDSESQTSAIRLGHQIIENSMWWNYKDENRRDFWGICSPRYSDEWITQQADSTNQSPKIKQANSTKISEYSSLADHHHPSKKQRHCDKDGTEESNSKLN